MFGKSKNGILASSHLWNIEVAASWYGSVLSHPDQDSVLSPMEQWDLNYLSKGKCLEFCAMTKPFGIPCRIKMKVWKKNNNNWLKAALRYSDSLVILFGSSAFSDLPVQQISKRSGNRHCIVSPLLWVWVVEKVLSVLWEWRTAGKPTVAQE